MTRSVIFIITAIFALGICSVHAQQQPCTPPPATGEAKLTPVWYDLSCIETRHSYSATIYLETLTSVGGMKIDSMRLCAIDTIPGDESLANEADFNGLPDGISYVTSNGTPKKPGRRARQVASS